MKGKLYGIGVGPGDKELITLKAINILKAIDILVCPENKKGQGSIAYEIVKDYVNKGARIMPITFPMVKDKDVINSFIYDNSLTIKEEIEKGNNVAFVTLGDPSNYSTYMYLIPLMKKFDIKVQTIPGITSYCAAACKVNKSLAMWDQNLCVYPLTKNSSESLDEILDNNDNIVILKASSNSKLLGEKIIEKGLENKFILISKCGMEDENVHSDINKLINKEVPYLSTVIINK